MTIAIEGAKGQSGGHSFHSMMDTSALVSPNPVKDLRVYLAGNGCCVPITLDQKILGTPVLPKLPLFHCCCNIGTGQAIAGSGISCAKHVPSGTVQGGIGVQAIILISPL